MTEEFDTAPAPPKLWDHVQRVFSAMEDQAVTREFNESDEPVTLLVYEGYTTHLFQALGLAVPQYTRVLRRLQDMRCIRQLGRGGGSAPSAWALLKRPALEDFYRAASSKSRGSRQDQTDANVAALRDRVTSLEEKIALIIDAVGVEEQSA